MNIIKTSVIAAAAITIVGCGSDSDHPSNPSTQVRVTHASADAPLVNIKANGAILAGLSSVDYQQGSGLITLDSGTYDVSVEGIGPGDAVAEVLPAPGVNFAPDMQYDIFALNSAANLEPVILSRSATLPDSNSVRLDVLHAHPDVGAVDIHLTAADSISSDTVGIAGLSFKEDSAALPITVAADTYRIRITLAGQSTDADVVFDSGNLDLTGGSDLMVTAVPNTVSAGDTPSPVDLLVADGSSVAVLRDKAALATVRAGHAIKDAPPTVDILANGAQVPGLAGLEYQKIKSTSVGSGTYTISVATVGSTDPVISIADQAINVGDEKTYFAVGQLDSSTAEIIEYSDDLRGVATYAKIRVVHARSTDDAQLVDIHAVADGGTFGTDTVVLASVPYKANALLTVPAGTYDFAVAKAGTTDILLEQRDAPALANGNVVTAFATEDSIALNVDK